MPKKPVAKSTQRHVMDVPICGVTVPVFIREDLKDGEVDCAGLYDTDSPTIWIDASVGDAYVQQVLIHEIGHAMLHLSGAMHELAEDMKPGTDIDRVEERLVRTLTPHIGALVSAKMGSKKRGRRA